jgi:hypothetical protein
MENEKKTKGSIERKYVCFSLILPNISPSLPQLVGLQSRVPDNRGKNWLTFLKLHESRGHLYIFINVALLRISTVNSNI